VAHREGGGRSVHGKFRVDWGQNTGTVTFGSAAFAKPTEFRTHATESSRELCRAQSAQSAQPRWVVTPASGSEVRKQKDASIKLEGGGGKPSVNEK